MLWVYILQCKHDKMTPVLLTAALTKGTEKHTSSNLLVICNRQCFQLPTTWHVNAMTIDIVEIMTSPHHMYVRLKIYIHRALNKVADVPRCQTNKNVFSVRLKRSVDRSTERKEVGRPFQILDPATAVLRLQNVLLVRGTTNVEVTDDRSECRLESAMSRSAR